MTSSDFARADLYHVVRPTEQEYVNFFFFYLTYLLQRSIFQDGRRFPLKSVTSDVKKNHIKKSYKDMAFKFALCIHRVYPKIHAKYQLI